jgi:RHS repeat-associated protein
MFTRLSFVLRFGVLALAAFVASRLHAQSGFSGVPVRVWAQARSSSQATQQVTSVTYGYVSFPAYAGSSFGGLGYYYDSWTDALTGASANKHTYGLYLAWYAYLTVVDANNKPIAYIYRTVISQNTMTYSYGAAIDLSGTFMPSAPGANDGTATGSALATGGGQGMLVSLGTPDIVRMEPGKSYTISISATNVTGTLNVAAPPGYRVVLNGQRRNSAPLASTMTLSLQPRDEGPPGAAGFASTIDAAKINWHLGLGTLRNGDDAGSIALLDPGLDASWATLFTPAALNYEAVSDEVFVYRVGGAIRQVIANTVAVDIVTLNSTSYELRCYNPAQIQSYVPCVFSGQPYATYRIERGATDTSLKLTKELRDIEDPNTSASPIVRRETMTLQRSGNNWTKNDWTLDGQAPLVTTTVEGGGTSQDRTETITIKDGTSMVALKATRTYHLAAPGESMVGETLGSTNAEAITLDYYTDVISPGNFGYVKNTQVPGGGWELYDYYDAGLPQSYRGGKVHYRYRPFGNSPGSPSSDPKQGETTVYEYGPDSTGFSNLPTLIETFVNFIPSSKATFSYTRGAASDGNPINIIVQSIYIDAIRTLSTVVQAYAEDTPDPFLCGKIISTQNPDGSITRYTYERGTWNGTAFTVSANLNSASQISVVNTAALGNIAGKSTRSVTIRDDRALVVRAESQVWLNGVWAQVSYVNYRYNFAGLLISQTMSNGATHSYSYIGHRKSSETDEAGVTTNYLYDAAGRVQYSTRIGTAPIASVTTRFRYDAADRLTEQRMGWGQAEQMVTTHSYDDTGRIVSESSPGSGASGYIYDPDNRTHTLTKPDGGTIVETMYMDGRLASRTGTAVVAQYFTYGLETDGRAYTQTTTGTANSPRWDKVWKDWASRNVRREHPSFVGQPNFVEEEFYDDATQPTSIGHLVKATQTGIAPRKYTYDALGHVVRSGIDVDDNGLIPASNDRIEESDNFIEAFNGALWSHAETRTYPNAASGAPIVTSIKRQRLTGFTAGTVNETQTTDIFGNVTTVITAVDRTAATSTVTTSVPNAGGSQIEKTVAGLSVSVKGRDGLATAVTYDALLRRHIVTDPRGNTVTTDFISGTTLVHTVKDGTGTIVATTNYDSSGRAISQTDAAGHHTYWGYNFRDQPVNRWGDATEPIQYGYDPIYGVKTTMATFRNGSGWDQPAWPGTGTNTGNNPGTGDTTTWVYDPASGALSSKIDAAGRAVALEYNARGQLSARTWARGVRTTYAYDPITAEQLDILYNDGTPRVHSVYNRMGQVTEVDDATGKHIFDRCVCGRISEEDLDIDFYGGRKLNYKINRDPTDVQGRVLGYTLTAGTTIEQDLTYDYDPMTDRFSSIATQSTLSSAAHTFHYKYLESSRLLQALSIDTGHPFTVTREFEPNRDVMTLLETKWSTATLTKYGYVSNTLGQRSSAAQSGDAFADYGDTTSQSFEYDAKGQLTKAAGYLGNTADDSKKLPDRQHEYSYDNIGNRMTSNRTGNGALQDNYNTLKNASDTAETADRDRQLKLNQIHSRENNTVVLSGTADPAAKVLVSGRSAAATRLGRFWSDDVTVANVLTPWRGSLKVTTAKTGTPDLVRTEVRMAEIAAQLQLFTYDLDGNLTSDGIWDYQWDAENRLTRMTTTSGAAACGMSNRRLDFTYDYLGRRAQKIVTDETTLQIISNRRFLYDGWNLVAEFSVSSSSSALTLLRSYTWGLDIAQTMSGGGGVGALLQIADYVSGRSYFPTYDGNGNVVSLISAATGAIAAVYEYSPYGEALRSEVRDNAVADQPWRFSTRYYDLEIKLFYYGRRYYDPKTGRWLSRDPKEELGGEHLYGFVRNNPINSWDYLGMADAPVFTVVTAPVVFNYSNSSSSSSNSTASDDDGYLGEDPACPDLREALARARDIRDRSASHFGTNGDYSSIVPSLSDGQRSYLGRSAVPSSGGSSLSGLDNTNTILTVTGAAAGYGAYQLGRVPTQTAINGPLGLTGYRNVVGQANLAGKASTGLGYAGVAVGVVSTIDSYANNDTGGTISNAAGTAVSVLALVPGPIGVIAGAGGALVSGSMAYLQSSVDAQARMDTILRAQETIKRMQRADDKIQDILADMDDKGCAQ